MLGIVVVDKPAGWTSHDVVGRLRRILRTKRIGHAGTLDPVATGVLVVAVGPATRMLQYLPLEPKVYQATMRFGVTTATYDTEGEITAEKPVSTNFIEQIENQLPRFRGQIQQLPPMYSAVKRQGKPLYTYARAGITIERDLRTVGIARFDIETVDGNDVTFTIECTGGTYVRTLAHDLGESIDCGAHIVGLRRLQVGKFHIESAITPDDVTEDRLMPLAQALGDSAWLEISDDQAEAIRQGRPISTPGAFEVNHVVLRDSAGVVVAMGRPEGTTMYPEVVIRQESHGLV